MRKRLPVHDDRAVSDFGILVEVPPLEVVARPAGGVGDKAVATPAKVVMKWMGEPDRFVFLDIPEGVSSSDLVG